MLHIGIYIVDLLDLEDMNMGYEICPDCNGSGDAIDEGGNIIDCPRCDGNGFIVTEDDDDESK
jgi:DnaJ-class molecular chaperone